MKGVEKCDMADMTQDFFVCICALNLDFHPHYWEYVMDPDRYTRKPTIDRYDGRFKIQDDMRQYYHHDSVIIIAL